MESPPTEKPATRPLAERERRRLGMLLSVFEGMSAQAQTCLSGLGGGAPNAITIGFAFLLGAKDPELGLLAALPVYGSVLQYVAAALGPRLEQRKPIVAIASTLARVAYLPIGLLPFLLGRDTALSIFLALWFVTNALMSLSGNLWTSWMADLVPPGVRGRYFSRRTRATTVVAVLVPLASSYVLAKWFGGVPRPEDGAGSPIAELQAQGFALVLGAAAIFGVICGFLLFRQPELPRATTRPHVDARFFFQPFRDRAFWPLLAFSSVFGAANGLANPFWTPFQLQELHLGFEYVNGWFVLLLGAMTILSLPLWGRLSDRFGNRPVIAIAVALTCTHPYYYVFATPERWWLMFFDAGSSGVAWAGYNLAIFNLVLRLAPRDRRELYIATQAVTIGVLQATFSVFAGRFVNHLDPKLVLPLPLIAPGGLDPRQQIFLVTAIARLACLGFFLGAVQEPKSKPIRSVVIAAGNFFKARFEGVRLMPRDE